MNNLQYIRESVEKTYKVDLTNKSRKLEYVKARNTFFYYAHRSLNITKTDIGKFIGKHHSTVIWGIKNYEQDPKFHNPKKSILDFYFITDQKVTFKPC